MPELWVCRSCARRIGLFASEAHARVWSTQSRPRQTSTESIEEVAKHADVERVFEEFKAGVEKQVRSDDFEVHLDLAEAYRDMGLLEDALREAGLVLQSAPKRVLPVPTKMTDLALRLVLTPPLLKPRGMHHLKLLLHPLN